MTDAEMVKAMEICKDKEIPCDDCPLVKCGDCVEISRQYFYDRFKQLQSENAALREENEALIREADENAALAMQHKMRADDLAKENAALRERLEKAVELPCRVGDKVYCIHGMSNPEMLEWQVNEIRITDHNYMLQLGRAGTKDYRNEASQFYGKWWFTELEAAEARLAELKGGKE